MMMTECNFFMELNMQMRKKASFNKPLRYLCLERDTMNKIDKKRTGISFKGYIYARYDQLVPAFGVPRQPRCSDNKIDIEWIIDTPLGIATIYNYKDGKAYLGDSGLSPEQVYEWHVGGKNKESYDWVKNTINRHIITGF